MDQEGFLPIGLIASFHRVQALTTNIALIVEVSTFFYLLWREISDFTPFYNFFECVILKHWILDSSEIIFFWLLHSENFYMVTCVMVMNSFIG